MIKFAGVDIPSYVKVNSVSYSILPPINQKYITIAGRAGAYDSGIDFGQREIELDVQIIGNDDKDVMKKARQLSKWLFHEDLKPLIFADEPDKQYQARVVNDTQLTETFRVGEGSIKFICPNAYAESITEKQYSGTPTKDTAMGVTNGGTTDTYPLITLDIKQDTPSIMVVSNDKFIQMGYSSSVDKPNVAVNPIVLEDTMNSYSGWSSATNVDGGTTNGGVTGTFRSDGQAVVINEFGDGGSGWYGASGIKTLSREIQDFTVEATVSHKATSSGQVGRIELYLLDKNNVHLGKIALVDTHTAGDFARFEARAGGFPNAGHYFINDFGSYKGVWSDFINGVIKIQRVGNRWWAYIGKVNPSTGTHNTRLARAWIDTKNQYSAKLAKIQIHIGKWGTNDPVNTMSISHLKVQEENISKVSTDTSTPIIFRAGDKVTLDNDKAIVYHNGIPAFNLLDPASDFFPLKEGANGLIVSPPVADLTVKFRERWL